MAVHDDTVERHRGCRLRWHARVASPVLSGEFGVLDRDFDPLTARFVLVEREVIIRVGVAALIDTTATIPQMHETRTGRRDIK